MPEVIDNPAIAMYVATAVALVGTIGLLWYVWAIDRRVADVRRRLDGRPAPASAEPPPLGPQRRVAQEQGNGGKHD